MGTTSIRTAALAVVLLVSCADTGSGGSTSSEPTSTTVAAAAARPPVSENPFAFGMAYDRSNGVVVAVAGEETWLFDVTDDTWTKAAAAAPSTDSPVRLVYAPSFGSVAAVTVSRSVLTYDVEADSWAVAVTGGGSSGRTSSLVGVDEKSGDLVILDLAPEVTAWVLNPNTLEWVEVEQSGGPTFVEGVGGPVMVYDEVLNAFVVLCYGADATAQDPVWLFDERTGEWRRLADVPAMPFGYFPLGHEAAFAASTGRSVFTSGGVTAEYDGVTDSWTLYAGGSAITRPFDSLGEPENFSPVVVYDPENERLLTYGGSVPYEPATPGGDDMWAYDPATHTWTQLLAATT